MKILLIILLVLAAIIAIVLIAALFIKKEYLVERKIVINRPKQSVFNYLKFLKNQDEFNKWVMADPNLKRSFRGTDGTVGFVYKWEGNKQAGKGEQEIIALSDGEKIDIEIRFEKPFKNTAQTPFVLRALSEQQTEATWSMIGKNKYPNNLMNPIVDKLLGKDMEQSLNTVKVILEKQQHT